MAKRSARGINYFGIWIAFGGDDWFTAEVRDETQLRRLKKWAPVFIETHLRVLYAVLEFLITLLFIPGLLLIERKFLSGDSLVNNIAIFVIGAGLIILHITRLSKK